MQSFDIVVVGGGMVGLCHAAALQNSGLKVAVIDAEKGNRPLSEEPEARVSAINLATQTLFKNLGVWLDIASKRLQAYQHMAVWDKDSFAKIAFSHQQVHQQQLGYIVENQSIRQALWDQLEGSSQVTMLAPAKIKKLHVGEREAYVHLDNDDMLTAQLIVGADGGNSFVRKQAELPLTFWDYDQHAIVATVRCQEPHQNVARQVFTEFGPLAFLPLYEKDLCSIVWSQDVQRADELMALDDEAFNRALTVAFDTKLGLCEVIGKRFSYPLKMQYCRQWVKDRIALIGDAAHTIHPLAGQGANLGFLDAAALAQHVIQLSDAGKDIGKAANLRPFERWRKTEAAKMVVTMESFKRLFGDQRPFTKLIRGLGMSAINHLPMAKETLIRQAMGIDGELPELAKMQN